VRAATTCFESIESRKSLSSIETRSLPDSLGATHRAFTFFLGNPISSIPVFLIQDFAELRVLRGEIESHFSAAAAATDMKRRPGFQRGRRGTTPQFLRSVSSDRHASSLMRRRMV